MVYMTTIDAIDIFMKYCHAKGLAPDTLRWYENILLNFASQYPKLPDSPDSIYTFLGDCQAGDERRHGYYRALRAFYTHLHRRVNTLTNPMLLVDPPRRKPKLPRPLTIEELEQLFAYPHSRDIRAALLFLIDTGSRASEAAGLNLNDISHNPDGYTARVTGKTGTRIVPISPETYDALNTALPWGVTRYRFRRLISFAFDNAKVQGSAINLRHSFATFWEGDEMALQQIMGHSHLTTTRIYRALRTPYLSAQHDKYTPLKMIYSTSKRMV